MKKTKFPSKLTLDAETLRRLQNADLERVNGGRCWKDTSKAPSYFESCATYPDSPHCI